MQMFLSKLMMDGFSIDAFLNTANGKIQLWAGIIVGVIGAVMMIAGIWKVGKGFISDKAQTNWVMAIGAIVLGGMLLMGGWSLLKNTSNGIANELNQMGGGSGGYNSGGVGQTIVYAID